MVAIDLKGVHKVRSKGRIYYYAWRGRGAPRLSGLPGSPEFLASYQAAMASRSVPDPNRFRTVILAYQQSDQFAGLASSTRKMWSIWLGRINDYFGSLHVAQFNRPDKIGPVIRRWRASYAATPRAADMGMQVLSRVLSHAVDQLALIATNPAKGISHLYKSDRADIIWTAEDLAALRQVASAEVWNVVDLAVHTGLRLGDLVRLSWSHVEDDAIVIATGKSRQKRHAVVPLYAELRAVLHLIPRRATTVLTNTRGRPWTADGFESSFGKAKVDAKLSKRDLHFHDLRGTAATRFYVAGLSEREIAEVLGWEEKSVSRIIRRYVGRGAAVREVIKKLDRSRSGT
jgi:integrase